MTVNVANGRPTCQASTYTYPHIHIDLTYFLNFLFHFSLSLSLPKSVILHGLPCPSYAYTNFGLNGKGKCRDITRLQEINSFLFITCIHSWYINQHIFINKNIVLLKVKVSFIFSFWHYYPIRRMNKLVAECYNFEYSSVLLKSSLQYIEIYILCNILLSLCTRN